MDPVYEAFRVLGLHQAALGQRCFRLNETAKANAHQQPPGVCVPGRCDGTAGAD